MSNSFQDSVEYLLSLGNEVLAMKLGLENIRKLLDALGRPQDNYLKVQVAGTNGKGSVCAFLNSICVAAGIRVGMFTSPHLTSITERVQINGEEIGEEEFARIASLVRETSERLVSSGDLENIPTFFEQVTAIALVAFADAKVELAILETGLGGRLDATTAADAEIAAITRIDLDHQQYLGETIEEIAAEKAAIIHEGARACIGRQTPEAMEVVRRRCAEVGVDPRTLEFARWERNSPGWDFVVNGFSGEEVVLQLEGTHQAENAALAIIVAVELRTSVSISADDIIRGLESAHHPGRIEWFYKDGVAVLLDGAHNKGGAEALVRYLNDRQVYNSIVVLYGSMSDKDVEAILEILSPVVTDLIVTQASSIRSSSADEIGEIARRELPPDHVYVVPDVEAALDSAIEFARNYPGTESSAVLVTGSLYLVGEARRLLKSQI